MTIHEPATLLTDILLGALASWLAWRLHRRPAAGHPAGRWWVWSLALTAASALVGGAYHGFGPNFSGIVQSVWWVLTLLLICLISAAMSVSLLHEMVAPPAQRPWLTVIAFKFLAFAGAAAGHPQFVVVIIDYGLTMLLWTIVAALAGRVWRGWMLAGVGLSLVAAAVQQLRWGFSARFNHNDVYHVIQAGALVAFYRAGAKFSGPDPRA
jgi:hypothetical protein